MNTNRLLFLKRNILSINMEENETIVFFISWIKDLKKKLADINEIIVDRDLVRITMNSMTGDYQMLITGINMREKAPNFEELKGILR